MNVSADTFTQRPDDEIDNLLDVLTNTGRRLEELTAGQVDTAADPDGRILLLRGTREQLKRSELARQTAILDALPANIALLDEHGIIISTNATWNASDSGVLHGGQGFSLGVNYLEMCDAEHNSGSGEARVIVAGIRSVLSGQESNFAAEYECCSPHNHVWFRVTVTPIAADRLQGVVVMFVNITARKEDEAKLLSQAERLTLATEVAKVGVWEWDLVKDILTWDGTMFGIYGVPVSSFVPYSTWKNAILEEDLAQAESILHGIIEHHSEATSEFRILRTDGALRYISSAQRVVLNRTGVPERVIGVNVDVTTRKESERALAKTQVQMVHLAEHDFLTGLPNQMVMRDRVEQAIKLASRNNERTAVLFLDMDGFKYINDSLGHPVGDLLLKSVASRLSKSVRESDTVSRLGGDEFIVLIPAVERPDSVTIVANRLLGAIGRPHAIQEHELHITACAGISIYPEDGLDADTLIRKADAAMYEAKRRGRSTFCLFHAELNLRAVERQFIEQNLRRALERNELSLHYQPKVDLKTGKVTGLEALMRWVNSERGFISPAKFIPVAEECGLIQSIGSWALREACLQACVWRSKGLLQSVAVNVSGPQFQRDAFEAEVFAVLAETGMNPEDLELEVTESLLMTNPGLIAAILQRLRSAGVKIAIDDFGTGYSSLSYLQKFPIDTLKIDQSFVRQLTASSDGTSIVTAILTMGHSLGMKSVAEGVETQQELDILKSLGCAEAQGYHFSRPLPASECEQFLERWPH